MPRTPKPKVAEDANQIAAQAVVALTGMAAPQGVYEAVLERQAARKKAKQAAKNPAAVSLGRLGGLKGGKARAEKLSPEKRSEIASAAAKARWAATE